jgi:beta-galactosidase GanA
MRHLLAYVLCACAALGAQTADPGVPRLRKQGEATQLVVDGVPFLILGGELHNSSSSNLSYMDPIWDRMLALNFNTVLAPVSWELIEPQEGRFDFSLVDGLVHGARQHGLHLVFLWLGSWKNGTSSYVPVWVKKDFHRFPRARLANGETFEVL